MKHVDILIERYPSLAVCREDIEKTVEAILEMYHASGKLLLCGNGGSCADCEHISGELLKGFLLERKPLPEEVDGLDESIASALQRGIPAVPLTSLTAVSTAFANDVAPENIFAQLVFSLGGKADVVLGISTSGNSGNVLRAVKTAKVRGLKTVAMTGAKGGKIADVADICIKVPETETFKVQELHLPVYHAICAEVEDVLFG